jgi:hypothetical protein
MKWCISLSLTKTVDVLYLMFLRSNDKKLLELLIDLEILKNEITNHLNDYAQSRSIKNSIYGDIDRQSATRRGDKSELAQKAKVIH